MILGQKSIPKWPCWIAKSRLARNPLIQVYDLITLLSKVQSETNLWSNLCEKKIAQYASGLRLPYENARKEISVLCAEKESLKDDIDILNFRLQQQNDNNNNNNNNNNAAADGYNASSSLSIPWLKKSARSSIQRKQAEIKLGMEKLDRLITERQSKFGIEMFDVLKSAETTMVWIQGDDNNDQVRQCFESAKEDIEPLLQQKEAKQEAIIALYHTEI